MCTECLAGPPPHLCPSCRERDAEETRTEVERVAARVALRRAGIAVRRRHGDPVVLWEGPLRLAVPIAGGVATAVGCGLALAGAQVGWGVDIALTALALGLVIGVVVRGLFGGVSRIAGLWAAATVLCGVAIARLLASSSNRGTAAPPWVDDLSTFVLDHAPLAAALVAVAAACAYRAAAGRRAA